MTCDLRYAHEARHSARPANTDFGEPWLAQFGAWRASRELLSIDLVIPGTTADFASRERLLAWLSARENEMADLLAELVAIPTENPPGRNYKSCAGLLEKQARTAFVVPPRWILGGNRKS